MKKGVYIDGYERPDIIEYRNNVFLLLMVLYKMHIVQ